MKTLILLTAMISATAFAADNITTFKCTTTTVIEGKNQTKIEFQVENLGQEDANYYTTEENSDDPVKMTPEDSTLMLNDNWSLDQKSDRIHMTSDGDGCQWTDFVLFKNTGYKRGYVRVDARGGCGATSSYSTVVCNVK